MPGTPIHGMRAESEAAHMHRCENEEGGPVYAIKKDLRDVRDTLIAMKATFKTWGKVASLSFAALTLAVGILTYVQATRDGRASHVVPQAHAETKGSP